MTIVAVHINHIELDLIKLLNFDDFNFYHDINGMLKNINIETGKLDNFFMPRCSK